MIITSGKKTAFLRKFLRSFPKVIGRMGDKRYRMRVNYTDIWDFIGLKLMLHSFEHIVRHSFLELDNR